MGLSSDNSPGRDRFQPRVLNKMLSSSEWTKMRGETSSSSVYLLQMYPFIALSGEVITTMSFVEAKDRHHSEGNLHCVTWHHVYAQSDTSSPPDSRQLKNDDGEMQLRHW